MQSLYIETYFASSAAECYLKVINNSSRNFLLIHDDRIEFAKKNTFNTFLF